MNTLTQQTDNIIEQQQNPPINKSPIPQQWTSQGLTNIMNSPLYVLIFHPFQDRVSDNQETHSPNIVRCTCGYSFPTSSIRVFILGTLEKKSNYQRNKVPLTSFTPAAIQDAKRDIFSKDKVS